jgi:hypothetical protein
MTPTLPAVQAIFLKGHLRLLAVGMRNSKLSGRALLDRASAITGKAYRRGQYDAAIADLQTVIDQTRAPRDLGAPHTT